MDSEISKLAELLRQNGHKISNDRCKFTLTTDLLNHLNSAFNLILERREASTPSFHVLNNCNDNNAKYRDLYFLYDFVQLVRSLKLTRSQRIELQPEYTDISKFKELHLLEIHKLNVNTILGIGPLRKKLQYLICERSITALQDILESSGADHTTGQSWCELKEAVFTHNDLHVIGNSLKYVPWLNTLDLSNNAIDNADEISCLPNLKYLNLSFNKLTKIPLFTGQICRRLQLLVLCNNFIDNIQDVANLVNLQQLNLVGNCLIEHDSLIPLAYLATLQYLNLKGNPLNYHPQHRIRSVRYLHKNTSSVKFILDDVTLNSIEQRSISSLHPKILLSDPSSSNTTDNSEGLTRSIRIRKAVIADDNLESLETTTAEISASIENFDSKEQIASLRKDYIKILYDKTGVNTKDSKENAEAPPLLSSTPLGESILNSIQDTLKSESTLENNSAEDYITASETLNKDDDQDEEEVYESGEVKEEIEELSDDEELESGEGNIFMANVKGSGNDVIVIVTKTHITEKDPITMKSLGRFTLDSLSVCDMIAEGDVPYVHLEFDTLRSDSSRRYFVEKEDERDRLCDKLRRIIEERPPREISNMFTCMKCSTRFGIEDPKTLHETETVCPVCESNLVFRDDGTEVRKE